MNYYNNNGKISYFHDFIISVEKCLIENLVNACIKGGNFTVKIYKFVYPTSPVKAHIQQWIYFSF